MAWQAGLRTGDFLIEVGIQVFVLSLRGESAASRLGEGSMVSAAWLWEQAVAAAGDGRGLVLVHGGAWGP